MPLFSLNPTKTKSWKALEKHFADIGDKNMNHWFKNNPNRSKELTIEWEDFFIDFSKNRLTKQTIDLLIELAEEMQLKDAIEKYFNGDKINETENRAVLHTALRAEQDDKITVDGALIHADIQAVKSKMKDLTEQIINGTRRGVSDKPFTSVVNIGIGGSDFGPSMVTTALQSYKNHLEVYFINNIDIASTQSILDKLNPETTLFLITSKTFTTLETLENAAIIRAWFIKRTSKAAIQKHFIGITNNTKVAEEFGLAKHNIFPMWDWVGGRYSLWSAVGLPICLSVGYANFEKLLAGANAMDTHFKNEEFHANTPVILGLIGIWYVNFFKADTKAVIPYAQYLDKFVSFLQQMQMESNGKSVDRNGNQLNYNSNPVLWGGIGTNVQHAFFQQIHQGTQLIPLDFIGFVKSDSGPHQLQNKLVLNLVAQSEALLVGKTLNEVKSTAPRHTDQDLHKVFTGNKPSTVILIDQLTPTALGKLIALYEHITFVQGVLWNIFSFDQFGVELGKARSTILSDNNANKDNLDASTKRILSFLKNKTKAY